MRVTVPRLRYFYSVTVGADSSCADAGEDKQGSSSAPLGAGAGVEFALDTLEVAAALYAGGTVGLVAELRNREKIMATTLDARQGLRIRYIEPASSPPAGVTNLDQYRDL